MTEPRHQPPAPPFIPARFSGGPQTPALSVMHATVGPTKTGSAKGVAEFFRTKGEPASSAHYVTDAGTQYQCVGDHVVAYHCGYNDDSLGWEMCIYPLAESLRSWLRPRGQRPPKEHDDVMPVTWLRPDVRAMMRRTARSLAQAHLAYGIPIRLLDDDELRDWDRRGRRPADGGIVTHAQMSRVFKRSTHWDPGAWPDQTFLRMVRRQARKLERRAAR